MFGAYDLNELYQTGLISMSPEKVFIHPDWNPSNKRYDADIAALIVEDEVPYTKYIRPICLSLNELEVGEGYVTGWGESQDKTKEHENLPKQIKIPIHDNEKCFLESNEFVQIASGRTICGGARDNVGPCRGDSGGGLYVKNSNVFYLKGLVSVSLTDNGECDVTNYALYTNVDKYMKWIQNPSEDAIHSEPNSLQTKPPVTQPFSSSGHPSYGENSQGYNNGGSFSPKPSRPGYESSNVYQGGQTTRAPPHGALLNVPILGISIG